ncbi:type VI secretion system-associated FHA domain protein TagH [Chelativorans sp. AA-79]|uniref:type VI secretion system-associated FHA domain protein TagH n=1 Tax=Chelativorans sp. AA-79 TaxID=3028735 RepID=UPI0023FA22E2|nr:type VI secretion system-associated FHA domain protein TagH [Chelativorans sp. AA-79]WEX10880.1 type VI secretion system-associated FHA domain protein TagH [Chelativorans sp. AA-79]
MTITLTIDNLDALPDGGPIRYQAHEHGFEIGREHHLDWTLPDPQRYISGRHCEFRYENGAYWLYDISRNGTYLNGSSSRVKSPYRLCHGDRLMIGHYIVRVELNEGEGEQPEPAAVPETPASFASTGDDVWDIGGAVPPPADRRDFMTDPARRRTADLPDQFLDLPNVREFAPQPERHNGEPPFASPSPGSVGTGSESPFGPGLAREGFVGARAVPAAPFPAGVQPTPVTPTPSGAPPRHPPPSGATPNALLEAVARGAGVPPDVFAGRDPQEVAQEIGEVLRASIENLTQLLKARAAAKSMTRSSSRTMIGAADNNPLKFVPAAAEAMEIMFRRNRSGYMGARETVEDSFADLKRHELATYSAMQKALARLLEEFSPDAIESKAGASAFASRKSRSWDLFVEKWEEKAASDNGILDIFLAYFAEAYDEAAKKTK